VSIQRGDFCCQCSMGGCMVRWVWCVCACVCACVQLGFMSAVTFSYLQPAALRSSRDLQLEVAASLSRQFLPPPQTPIHATPPYPTLPCVHLCVCMCSLVS
jgi:hypothetical protein